MHKEITTKLRRVKFLREQAQKLEVLMAHIETTMQEQIALADEIEAEACAAIGDSQISTEYGIATVREERIPRIMDASKLPAVAMRQSVSEEPNMAYITHMLRSGEQVPGACFETVRKVVFR